MLKKVCSKKNVIDMPRFQKSAVEDYFNNKPQYSGWRFMPANREQRRIAEILSAADRKLELERRRKEKLKKSIKR